MDQTTEHGTHLPAPSAHPGADRSWKTGEAGRTGKNRGRKTGDPPAVFPYTALLLLRSRPQVLPLPGEFQVLMEIFKDSGDVYGLQSFFWTTMDDLSDSLDREEMKKGITDALRPRDSMTLTKKWIRHSMKGRFFIGPDRPHRPPPITASGKNQGEAPRSSVIGCGLRLLFRSLMMHGQTLCSIYLLMSRMMEISGDGH